MIQGAFVENMPLIKIDLAWGQTVQAPFVILDTGFTGDIQITPEMANELGLTVSGVTKTRIANGDIVTVPTALAIAAMEGLRKSIQVLIANSPPLAGISFLTKFSYKAIIDCKYRTVMLQRA